MAKYTILSALLICQLMEKETFLPELYSIKLRTDCNLSFS